VVLWAEDRHRQHKVLFAD
jgi:hypothetical protein